MDKQVSMPGALGPSGSLRTPSSSRFFPTGTSAALPYLGSSSNPELEREALDRIGSYGQQIGHLVEAMEVIINKLGVIGSAELNQQELDALQVVLGNVATMQQLKSKHPPYS